MSLYNFYEFDKYFLGCLTKTFLFGFDYKVKSAHC